MVFDRRSLGEYGSGLHGWEETKTTVGVWMGDTAHDSEPGQALLEYALILAGIAFLAALVVYVTGAMNGLLGSASTKFPTGPTATEPLTPPPVQWPTSVEQCLHGGWRDYPQFTDQAACVRSVTG